MKQEIQFKTRKCLSFSAVQEAIDDWIDYYNKDRYKAALNNLSPNEFYKYITTGEYPLKMLH